jgi:hypothetical protein
MKNNFVLLFADRSNHFDCAFELCAGASGQL